MRQMWVAASVGFASSVLALALFAYFISGWSAAGEWLSATSGFLGASTVILVAYWTLQPVHTELRLNERSRLVEELSEVSTHKARITEMFAAARRIEESLIADNTAKNSRFIINLLRPKIADGTDFLMAGRFRFSYIPGVQEVSDDCLNNIKDLLEFCIDYENNIVLDSNNAPTFDSIPKANIAMNGIKSRCGMIGVQLAIVSNALEREQHELARAITSRAVRDRGL